MSKFFSTLFSFFFGFVAGTIAGILYAPEKGSNTRDRLSFQLDKYRKVLESFIEDLMNGRVPLPNNQAKAKGEAIIKNAKEKAERLLGDVDKLIKQVKKK